MIVFNFMKQYNVYIQLEYFVFLPGLASHFLLEYLVHFSSWEITLMNKLWPVYDLDIARVKKMKLIMHSIL